MKKKWTRLFIFTAGAVVFAYAAAVSVLYFKQTELLYRADPLHISAVDAGLSGVMELALPTSDGEKIQAWYSLAKPNKATILFCHGKGGNMAYRAKRWQYYVERGYGVMFFDYHGFGGSTGAPTEEHLRMDARTAYDWLREQSIPAKDIALVGESLGSGVCTLLAAQVLAGSLELEAAYSSIADIAAERHWWAPVRFLIKDNFDAEHAITKIRSPLFQQHGELDDTIPIHFGAALFKAAPSPKQWLKVTGGHHALGPEGWQRGLNFIEAVRNGSWMPQE
jgi:uncharacterized protein